MPGPEATGSKLARWVAATDRALWQVIQVTGDIPRLASWNAHQSFTVGALYTACLRSSGSALVLLDHEKVWDAECLMRSVIEGSLKLTYLLDDPQRFEERFEEYAVHLHDIELYKGHGKAEALLRVVPDPGAIAWRPIRDALLPAEQYSDIAARFPKDARRALESKWGFTGLLAQLQKTSSEDAALFAGMPHYYAIGSHYLHADYTGVSTMMERDYRDAERRDAIHMAHASRILSDLFWLAFTRVRVGLRYVGADITPLMEVAAAYRPTADELAEVTREFERVEYGNT